MWRGRFGVIVPVLALAGALAAKKTLPPVGRGHAHHGGLFIGLFVGVC